jgi:hypothetical protein
MACWEPHNALCDAANAITAEKRQKALQFMTRRFLPAQKTHFAQKAAYEHENGMCMSYVNLCNGEVKST